MDDPPKAALSRSRPKWDDIMDLSRGKGMDEQPTRRSAEGKANEPPSVLEVNDVLTAYRLSWLANFMSGPLYAALELSHGLSRPEFIVLLNGHHRPGTTAHEVCLATGRPRNSISRGVLALVRKGLIVQEQDVADRRLRRLRLTAAGEALYASIIPLFVQRQAEMLSPLTPGERNLFAGLLAKLVRRDDDWAKVF